ncbi:AzlD domain-containing protein [Clostridiales bacterium F-3ap]|uniref:AzlD domain-containing protein n=2 Tax=Anaerotalea alkaliphila TaxID=2662126 RepID=A0A7X5HVV1_9FIRM|nr:AzlD domain-containing protein [Anaerotalea alkaliphila]
MALSTYLIRMAPLTFFRRHLKNRRIRSFLDYIPFTVLGAMTFPGIFESTGSTLSAAAGCAVAFLLAYREKSLLTVTLAAVGAVYLAERLLL